MGQSVVMACPLVWQLADFADDVEEVGRRYSAKFFRYENELQISVDAGRPFVIVNEFGDPQGVAEDYASNSYMPDALQTAAHSLRYLSIRFSDIDMVRQVLVRLALRISAAGHTAWIDTDYGWAIDTNEFLRNTARDPNWDWRFAIA